MTALSGMCEVIQLNQLHDFGVLAENDAGNCPEEFAEADDDLCTFQLCGLYDRASVGIDAKSPVFEITGDFF